MRRLLPLAAGVLLTAVPAARAATITVDITSDTVAAADGHCSLREAVNSANNDSSSATAGECAKGSGADTIVLGGGPAFTLSGAAGENANVSGDLDVVTAVTIQGAGASVTTIDANHVDRAIDVTAAGDLTLQGVTITGGVAPNGATNATNNVGSAGGPASIGGNAGNGPGGAGDDGGGIRSAGTLTILDSVVSQNHAGNGGTGGTATGGFGGGGSNGGYGGNGTGGAGGAGGSGGGIFASGTLTLTRVVVTSNVAGNGGTGGTGLGGSGGFTNGSGGQGGVGGTGIGGVGGAGGTGGGIASSAGKLTIDQSSVRMNIGGTGGHGGAAQGGQGGTSVAATAAGGLGGDGNAGAGGVGGRGAGIRAAPTSASSIDRSLIDGNTAGTGGTGGNGTGGNGGEGVISPAPGGAGGSGYGGTGGAGGRGAAVDSQAVTYANDTIAADKTGSGAPGGTGKGGTGGPVSSGTGGSGGPGQGGTGGDAGAGALATGGTTTIVHATITGNEFGSAGGGGTGLGGGGGNGTGASGSAFGGTGGAAGTGAAIFSAAATTLNDSIVSGNSTPGCAGTPLSGAHDISLADATCPGANADPFLLALADNGGPTLTRKPGSGSPAIDLVPASGAGCAATDQRLVLRPFGGACDAGAYELAPPSLAIGDATGVSLDSATLQAQVNPNAQATSFHFEFGTTTAYGSSTPQQDLPAGVAPVAVSAAIGGLAAGTTYHVRLVGTNADGAAASPDRIFTTTSKPGGGGGNTSTDTTPPVFLSASLKPKRFKASRGTTCRYRLSEDARVVFTLQKRKGKRYVKVKRFTKSSKAGANKKKFVTRKLKPGRYRATLVATDAAGNRSKAKRLTFRVKR